MTRDLVHGVHLQSPDLLFWLSVGGSTICHMGVETCWLMWRTSMPLDKVDGSGACSAMSKPITTRSLDSTQLLSLSSLYDGYISRKRECWSSGLNALIRRFYSSHAVHTCTTGKYWLPDPCTCTSQLNNEYYRPLYTTVGFFYAAAWAISYRDEQINVHCSNTTLIKHV